MSCGSQVPKPLDQKQLAALVGAADARNPALVMVAAYVANTVVESDRARTQTLLEWHQVSAIKDEASNKTVGHRKVIHLDKRDRLQKGKVKDTPCPSTCKGYVIVDEHGRIDATEVCPTHLLFYAKSLWADLLYIRGRALWCYGF